MLAERRSREKWSQDPRNTFWSRDRSKYGYRMLERMGWSEGRGLGLNEDGLAEPVKVHRKKDCSGVGARKGRDDDWIAQQSSFDQLLSELNAHGGCAGSDDTKSKELIVTAQRSKALLYRRFLQSKDLSVKSEEDMACVLGRKRRRGEELQQPSMGGDNSGDVESHGVPTVKSRVSVQEYFAKKMRQLQETQGEGKEEEGKSVKMPSLIIDEDQTETKRRRRRKRNRTSDRTGEK